jgi:hypothetical protein
MSCYSGIGSATLSTSAAVTVGGMTGSTSVVPRVYEVIVGSYDTPADQCTQFYLQRTTAAGTPGSSPTPQLLGLGRAATSTFGSGTYSVEPTYTSGEVPVQFVCHQRNTFKWWAFEGREIFVPATSGAGLGLKSVDSTQADDWHGTVFWME